MNIHLGGRVGRGAPWRITSEAQTASNNFTEQGEILRESRREKVPWLRHKRYVPDWCGLAN
jgi:hypothetical protein